jgi:hypothetical protein
VASVTGKPAAGPTPPDVEADVIAGCTRLLSGLAAAAVERVITFLAKRHIPNVAGITMFDRGHPLYQHPAPAAPAPDTEESEDE